MVNLPDVASPKLPRVMHRSQLAPPPITNPDSNIFVSCLHLFSIWGKILEYTSQVQSGQPEEAWLASSTYSTLGMEFYQFETSLAQIHRFENVGLNSRSSEEVSQHMEYWSSWLLLQTTFHTGHALLNHPLLHALADSRPVNERPTFKPPSFLQQTVDQALLHAGWTSRLIRAAGDMGIRMNNPIIAHQVIVSATVHWIFSFATDPTIAARAISDLDQCYQFISNIATRWPRFAQKQKKATALSHLQAIARQTRGVLGPRGLSAPISSLLWNLIDPHATDIDFTVCSTLNPGGDRVPTKHLAQLHERSHSTSNTTQRTSEEVSPDAEEQQSLASVNFMQCPGGFLLDEELISAENHLSESLDFQFLGGFGNLGGL
ncbi:hypothetical protein AbraIFM66950_007506 [Aspergillus brasiliensis]|nr:hypothetical protein AbraIFM66950_007506 [Aspergillus brasiliensis]